MKLVTYIKACSHRAKVNAKAKQIKEQSEEIKDQRKNFENQNKFSLSRSLSLGVNRPLFRKGQPESQ